MTDKMTGAALFVACLEEAGIDRIYGVPGEENTELMLALKQSAIRFILTRHEQAAAFMASVHGRLTGRPAACLSTLGPGATNLLTGVADATLDYVPLIAITAQADRRRMSMTESHQVIDLEALFRPVTKSSHTLISAETIPGAVAEAVRLATAPRPGAVHLCLPEDIAGAEVSGRPVALPRKAPPLPAPTMVLEAIRAVRKAKRPVLVTGNAVVRADVGETVARFAEDLRIPLVSTFMGAGILGKDHPLNMFTLGQPFCDHIDAAMADADLILAVGFDPVEYPPAKLTRGGDIPVVSLSEAPLAADVGWSVAAEITGDLRSAIKALGAGLDGHSCGSWPAMDIARTAMLGLLAKSDTRPEDAVFRAEDILARIEAQLDAEDIVLSGVGTHKMKVARSLVPKRAGQLIIGNGLAGMGLALPGAIAAADTMRGAHVLAICGDGDFLMNLQDMETATRLGQPLTVMVWEDGGYGLIEAKQEQDADDHTDLAFGNPGWADLARAFGWDHVAVDRFDRLDGALAKARGAEKPVLMTMKVAYQDPLRNRAGGAIKSVA